MLELCAQCQCQLSQIATDVADEYVPLQCLALDDTALADVKHHVPGGRLDS